MRARLVKGTSIMTSPRTRAAGIAAALGAALAFGACSNMLDVQNPGAITSDNLKNASMVGPIVNGAVGEFQVAFDGAAFYGGIFTDELLDRQVFHDDQPIDQRNIDPSNSLINGYVYVPLQRARGAADHGITDIKQILGDKAGSSLDVARLYDYAGYSLELLAESFCQAPIDVSKAYSPAELSRMAIDRFGSALTIAAAAKAAGASAAAADSLTNLANLGIARASLYVGDKATALAKAQLVPADFAFWVNHSANSSREYNFVYDAVRSGNQYISYDPSFLGLHDPRIPQDTAPILVPFQNGVYVWIPFQPEQYSGYQPAALNQIQKNTGMRFGSGLEAQYIAAEAQGPTAATLAFVNARRAVGGQPPVNDSGDQLMADLRDQRRRDFFLDAYRLGDLRRYKQLYNADQFPSGVWPADNQTVYGSQTCFPLPTSENSNPNLGS